MMKNVLNIVAMWWIITTNRPQGTYTAKKCGHATKLIGLVYDGQKKIFWKMPLVDNINPNYCLDCIGAMSILCAWCNQPITVGSPITLYEHNEDFDVPKHAVHHDERALVGCMRSNCADYKEDVAGIWVGEVKKLSPRRRAHLISNMRGWK